MIDLIDRQPVVKDINVPCTDTISRQAAIDAIQKAYVDTEEGTDKCGVWKNIGLTTALHIMQDLPSADPEPWKGENDDKDKDS